MQNATHNSTKQSNSSKAQRPHRERLRNKSRRRTRREISAGGIIIRRCNGLIDVFFIRDPFGKWTFPKGHQELGETLAETAVREIREETGLTDLKFIAPLGRTWFSFKRNKTLINKTVFLFLFEAPKHAKEEISGHEGISEGGWFPMKEALTMSGYRNLDQLLTKALRITAGHRRKNKSITTRA